MLARVESGIGCYRGYGAGNRAFRWLGAGGIGLLYQLLSPSAATAQQIQPSEADGAATAARPEVQAEAADERARRLFMEGHAAWEAQRYDEACRLFQQSQTTKSSAAALLNLGRCHELDGARDRARETYRAVLAAADEQPDQQKRKVWKSAALEALERLGPEQQGSDAVLAPTATTVGPRTPAPGVNPPSEPAAASLQGPNQNSGFFQSESAPWIFLGSGGVLVLASVGTGIVALNARAKLDRECGPSGSDDKKTCDQDLSSTKDRAHNMAILTDVLWISGAVVAAAGVGLWLAQPEEGKPSVGLWCGGAGCQAAVTGQF